MERLHWLWDGRIALVVPVTGWEDCIGSELWGGMVAFVVTAMGWEDCIGCGVGGVH